MIFLMECISTHSEKTKTINKNIFFFVSNNAKVENPIRKRGLDGGVN